MKWTVLTLVMLITVSFAIGEEAGTNAVNGDTSSKEFLANYIEMEKTLHACAIPSNNMFTRPLKDGQQQNSEFDLFCYHQALKDPLSQYLCHYFKFLVETYYGQHCGDPNRQPMDTTPQYERMLQTPFAPCKKLVETVMQQVQPGVNQPVFSSIDDCETVCHQSLFCTNLAYLLSIFTQSTVKADIQRRDPYWEDSFDEGGYTEGPSKWENEDNKGGYVTGNLRLNVDRTWNPCSHLFCENGGKCVESYTSYNERRVANCSCPDGYKGKYREYVDRTWHPCSHMSCRNGGTCVERYTLHNKPKVANCVCPEGFEGKYCDYGEDRGADLGISEGDDAFRPDKADFDEGVDQDWTYQRETEEPGSHFFVFLVVSIVLIIFMYIVYHNKTKIKEYFGDLQAERKANKNTKKVNYNVYIRLEERT